MNDCRFSLVFACLISLTGYSQRELNERVVRSFASVSEHDVTLDQVEQQIEGILMRTGGSVVVHRVAYREIAVKPYYGYFFSAQGVGVDDLVVEVLDPEVGWRAVTTDEHVPAKAGIWQSALSSVAESYAPIELRLSSAVGPVELHEIDFSFITYRVDDEQMVPLGGGADYEEGVQRGGVCSCPLPTYFTRTQYGVPNSGAQTCFPFISAAPVTHLIVHHEGGGASQTSSNWAQRAFNIWNYHVNVSPEDFCDVAYNWLLAPNGSLYEGRWGSAGSNVRGAHMCGMHENKLGVCIMGDWTSGTPPTACYDKLDELLAWKACEFSIDPFGDGPTTSYTGWMNNISGHQDGCAPGYTVCPGNIQTQLGAIRNGVDQQMSSCGTCPQPTNDGCSGSFTATLLLFGASCNPISSTSCGATASGFNTCTGAQDDDVFFRFVPSSQSATITVDGSSGYNAVFQVLAGPCGGGMSELDCVDNTGSGGVESTTISGLTIGVTYFIRVGHSGAGSGTSGDFTICVQGSVICPDPTISSLTFDPPTPTVGQDVDFDIVITNAGTASTVDTDDPRIEYWVDGAYTGLDDDETTVIGPGGSSTESLTNYVFSTPGTHTVCAILDPYPNECPTSNNTTCAQVTVQEGCLVPEVPAPSFGSASCPGPSQSSTIPIQWEPVPGAAGYKLRLGIYPYEEGIFVDVGAGDCYPGTSYSIPLASFTTGLPCYWSVSAYGACGNDACQSAYSSPRYFSVPPVVLAPNGTTICDGESAELTLETFWVVDAPGTNSAQWYRDGVAIPGATGGTYAATQSGGYSVVLTFTGSQWCTDPVVLGPSNIVQVVEDNLDTDGDGVPNCSDNCPNVAGQQGSACNDGNACTTGDVLNASCVCTGTLNNTDTDGDGVPNCSDNCPNVAGQQGSACNDGNACTMGDVLNASCVCTGTLNNTDTDGDGVPNCSDNCPNVAGQQGSVCNDNNACTINDVLNASCVCVGTTDNTDTDGDGVPNCSDNCPNVAGQQGSACNDGNACTTDDVLNASCVCTGTLNNTDTDGDGVPNCSDNCPNVAGQQGSACNDGNACTTGDVLNASCVCTGTLNNTDTDGDGVPNCSDNCPNVAGQIGSGCDDGNALTVNDLINASCVCIGATVGCIVPGDCNDQDPCTSDDCVSNACVYTPITTDTDGDGIPDCSDNCPNTAGQIGDSCDDGNPLTIDDMLMPDCTCGDPVISCVFSGDCNDNNDCTSDDCVANACVFTPLPDGDSDGTCDAQDGCPADPNKIAPGACGCGEADTDTDGDGAADCVDPCPFMADVAPGDPCDDGNSLTSPDAYTANCVCFGPTVACVTAGDCNDENDCTNDACIGNACVYTALPDSDGDGACDASDICPGFDDFADLDNDGTPNGCDPCNNNLDGTGCTDNDPCTANDVWSNCVCAGITGSDSDGDGTFDCDDGCPNDPGKTTPGICGCGSPEPGTLCDDADAGTVDDQITASCVCAGVDTLSTTIQMHGSTSTWFTIHPNPSSGGFQVIPTGTNTEPIVLRVYDALGQLVHGPVRLSGADPVILNLEKEASGNYFLRAARGGENRVFEVLIQR